MPTASERFSRTVLDTYRGLRTVELSKSLKASAEIEEAGHPAFSGLEMGEQAKARVVSVFLDLSDFTRRSFWEDPADVARLADGVLSGFTGIVRDLGGHVVGLRGDGLYAVFGPTDSPEIAVDIAGLAAAAALDLVKNGLNADLARLGIDPVIAHAGADFGEVVFVRTGVAGRSEVNVVGFTANFAAKCEKLAAAWEVVVGQGFADVIVDKTILLAHEKPAKTYTRHGVSKSYGFYRYRWESVVSELEGVIDQLSGRALEEIGA